MIITGTRFTYTTVTILHVAGSYTDINFEKNKNIQHHIKELEILSKGETLSISFFIT